MQNKKTLVEPAQFIDHGQWLETTAGILYVVNDEVQFEDDFSHWRNGVCRLLEISEADGRNLIARVISSGRELYKKPFSQLLCEHKLEALKKALAGFFSENIVSDRSDTPKAGWGRSFDGAPADTVFSASIGGNRKRMIVGSTKLPHGWQIDATKNKRVTADSVDYDEAYYQHPRQSHCGMKDYVDHADWRMEKARRLLRSSLHWVNVDLRPSARTVMLDIGSAIGYFRQAAEELNIEHHGLDLSPDAIKLCQERFGFDTFCGSIEELPELAPQLQGRCDLITLWDTIEHLDDPLKSIKTLKEFLSPNGILIVRTPNLSALEADLLQDMYYSYKLDHIHYFSPQSLNKLCAMASLRLVNMETSSHLFKGLLGANFLYLVGKELRGADIFAVFSN